MSTATLHNGSPHTLFNSLIQLWVELSNRLLAWYTAKALNYWSCTGKGGEVTILHVIIQSVQSLDRLTWKSLKRVLPLEATISKSISNCCPSVVSLYGAQRAKVRKSKSELITSAPVPWSWKKAVHCLEQTQWAPVPTQQWQVHFS